MFRATATALCAAGAGGGRLRLPRGAGGVLGSGKACKGGRVLRPSREARACPLQT